MVSLALQRLELPLPAPTRVLATGAFLKNTACLLQGREAWLSPVHGDLSTPAACQALQASVQSLQARAHGPIEAVAHDLHPDFHSSHLALALAAEWGVPAVAVQHHHAHLGVLQAQAGLIHAPLVGLALDGVGLGSDGHSWGGELLRIQGAECERLTHLPWLPLPGGDAAAREPWRLAAAVLHHLGRADRIVPRFGPSVGATLAAGVRRLLERDLHCPRSSAAGRWFDAAAGLLGLSLRQTQEAEAAIALERAATEWSARGQALPDDAVTRLDLWPLFADLADETDPARGAARFHQTLGHALVAETAAAAARHGAKAVALGGGCFFNALLRTQVAQGLAAHGLAVLQPRGVNCGDAGLALGQAWVAALQCQPSARAGSADGPGIALSPDPGDQRREHALRVGAPMMET